MGVTRNRVGLQGVGCAAWLALLGCGFVLLWLTSSGPGDRLLTVVVATVVGIGILGQYGATPRDSRLPPVAQGFTVGVALGAAFLVVGLGALETWGPLGGLLALPALFPATIPARWRPALTARWSDLVRDQRHDAGMRPPR